jgi:hypothetical protein
MTAPLIYHNLEMRDEPINIDMLTVARLLRDNHSVVVELEPGDATYYCLLLVPCKATEVAPYLSRFGIPPNNASEYIIVTYLHDTHGDSFYSHRYTELHDMLNTKISNEWTQMFLVWWLQRLWSMI